MTAMKTLKDATWTTHLRLEKRLGDQIALMRATLEKTAAHHESHAAQLKRLAGGLL